MPSAGIIRGGREVAQAPGRGLILIGQAEPADGDETRLHQQPSLAFIFILMMSGWARNTGPIFSRSGFEKRR